MGDRANVFVVNEEDGDVLRGVYLYAHWDGYRLPEVVAAALDSTAGRGRWTDEIYLARIIFCKMVAGDQDGETGYGISSLLGDNEHDIIVIDCGHQEIRVVGEGVETDPSTRGSGQSFEDFVTAVKANTLDWN